MLRAPSVAQIVNLPYRRLAVGEASVQPSASPFAHAWRITNPRYGGLPACATNHPACAPPAQAAVAGGAMLRAPSVAQIVNLPYRRLAVGEASVQPSASPFAHAWRITNPRYGRLPACATNHPACAPPAQAAVARGAMLRAPSVAQASSLLERRLPVGEASVQPSASPPAHTLRITNPRYGRLPACATNHPACAAPAQAAVAGGAMLRAPPVAQAPSLLVRRLPVGETLFQPSASPPAHTSRITNPRYGRLPACATNHPACAPPAQAAVAGGAMLRAPPVAQASSLLVRRLPVGGASVQPSASPPVHAWRITNPRYGRLPACATNHPTCATPAQAAVAGGAMLRAPPVAQASSLRDDSGGSPDAACASCPVRLSGGQPRSADHS
jgi:hypothetical protein